MRKLEKKNIQEILALSPMQEGMLFHYLKNPKNDHYFEQLTLGISGEIDFTLFTRAWNFVVGANEMLRVVFRWEKLEKPTQIVLKQHTLDIRFIDLSTPRNPAEQAGQFEDIKIEDRKTTFDLREVPFRVILCKVSVRDYRMVINNHHILYDGWSTGIILKEFFHTYSALKTVNTATSTGLKPPFKEFLTWQQNCRKDKQKAFWELYLKGFATPTRLPIKRDSIKEDHEGGVKEFQFILKKGVKDRLDGLLKEWGVTLAAFFYCAWGILLQKYSGSDDVVFGTTVSGRSAPIKGIENMVGLFINTIPLRLTTKPREKIKTLVERINRFLAIREEYESTPLVDIIAYSDLQNKQEFFDFLLVVENYPLDLRLRPGNSQLSPLMVESYEMIESTPYPVTVSIITGEAIVSRLVYDAELFEPLAISRLGSHFKTILTSILEDLDKDIECIELLTEEEKQQIVVDFNKTDAEYPRNKTLHQLYREQAERTPYRAALAGPGVLPFAHHVKEYSYITISYQELNKKSDRLAHLLMEQGAVLDTIIGIMIERSIEMITGILGILKAGCIYLPIDPAYPKERIKYLMKDSNIKMLVSDRNDWGIMDCPIPVINPNLLPDFKRLGRRGETGLSLIPTGLYGTSAAYIIYTSGSTGKPKGVIINHHAVVNTLWTLARLYPFSQADVYLLKTSYLFDVSLTELFGWFLGKEGGGRLAILEPGAEKDPKMILDILDKMHVTHINFVPSAFNVLVNQLYLGNAAKLSSLKYIFLAGEVLLPEVVNKFRRWNQAIKLENLYGPTEAAIYATLYRLDDWNGRSDIPIGKPLCNTRLYILNRWGGIQPVSVPGELAIGGVGLARGYLNNPELTKEKFVAQGISTGGGFFNKNPQAAGNKLYKTGDLTRWQPEGIVEFLGRIDQQVKIRGFRIEPGEIENHLLKNTWVKEAVVTTREDKNNENYLCAYIVLHSANSFESSSEMAGTLKNHLSQVIPDYMIPSYFVLLDKIPLTSTGKVDRMALPEPTWERSRKYSAPRNKTEQILIGIFEQLLNLGQGTVGIDDNFFQIGGHSLKAILLVNRIFKELNVNISLSEGFKIPTVRLLASHIDSREREIHTSIEPVEKRSYYTLSSAQNRLYTLQQMDEQGIAYNIPFVWKLEGDIDINKLEEVFIKIIRQHESLRTSFYLVNETPVQRINEEVKFHAESYLSQNTRQNIYLRDLKDYQVIRENQSDTFTGIGGVDFLQNNPWVPDTIINQFIRPFNLANAPLFRVGLIALKEEGMAAERVSGHTLLMVDMHHIISDGISLAILMKDFTALFAEKELPEIKLQYKDYALWQYFHRESEYLKQQEMYWKKEFEGEIPILRLPADFPRPPLQTFEGNSIHFSLDTDTTAKLNALMAKTDATMYMVLLAIYNIFLSRVCGQEDIVIGTPVAGRRHADLEEIIGMFVNTLAIRNCPYGEKRFRLFLYEVKEKVLNVFENQEYSYEALVNCVAVSRDTSRNPLFDTMFILQSIDTGEIKIPGLRITPYRYENSTSKFDLTLTGSENEDKLSFTFNYCIKLFTKKSIERFIAYLKKIISDAPIFYDTDVKLSEIEIISMEEKRHILFDFNDTEKEYPQDKTIHGFFEKQVEKTPSNSAILGHVRTRTNRDNTSPIALTYRKLHEQSNRLAHVLRVKGAKPDTIVGIITERSVEMVIGILGILKSGGAYLPIDPEYPKNRIDYLLKDSSVKIFLTRQEIAEFSSPTSSGLGPKDTLSHLHLAPARSTALAYIIYTSGTTGKPKGVLVEHSSVVNLLYSMQNLYPFRERDVYLLKTPYIFDVSVTELFGWYMGGGRIAIMEANDHKDPLAILNTIERERITHINFVPSMFNVFSELLKIENVMLLSSLKYIFLAGEALLPELVGKFKNLNTTIRLENIYGPTESSVYASKYSLSDWSEGESIPIGKPLPNIRQYILNKFNYIQPIGLAGELCLGGSGLARGYLNRPELTKEKFVRGVINYAPVTNKNSINTDNGQISFNTSPINICSRNNDADKEFFNSRCAISNDRFYRTGDFTRWLPDGNIEFLGRIDQQVKIRGFRIELGEIENCLLAHKEIKECVVTIREEEKGNKYLCAYLIAHSPLNTRVLRDYLSKSLPDYIIPAYFVTLDKMPLTSSGKIDVRALPEAGLEAEAGHAAPRDEIEERLAGIWAEVLGVEKCKIGIESNFFELGGHSLKAIGMANKIHKTFGVKMTIQNLFRFPTITKVADLIKTSNITGYEEIEKQPEQDYYEISYSQKRLWFLFKMDRQNTAFNLPVRITIHEAVDESIIRKILEQWVLKHESFRTFFKEIAQSPVQVIEPVGHLKLNLKVSDWSKLDAVKQENKRSQVLREESSHIFNLEEWPLFRARWIKYSSQEYDFVLNMHHIITDGWSLEVLRQEFYQMVKAYKMGIPCDMEPLRIQYKDYTAWQKKLFASEEKIRQAEDFWNNYLSGNLPVLDLPYDFSPGTEGKHNKRSSAYCFTIEDSITQGLRSFAGKEKASLFMVLLASFNILLSQITGQEEILMAVPAAARQHWELKNIIGMFVNTLLLRTRVNMNATFDELFRAVQADTFNILEYQGYPLELIFSRLKMKYPQISVFFNMVNIGVSQEEQLTDLNSYHIEEVQETKFDLHCYLIEYKNGIQVSCHYFRELFFPETIERIMRLFIRMLDHISRDSTKKVKEYSLSEKKKNILGGLKNKLRETEEKAGIELNIKKEVKESQQTLSKVNLDFLEYVEKNPGCCKKSNFQKLELNDDLFRLQPWPTFISPKTKIQFQEAGVKLFNLIKQIPAKVFKYDFHKMSMFYETPMDILNMEMEGVTEEHIDTLLSRGDFILSSNGLKCLEYNVTTSLGGWQIPIWESLYLKTPILARFFKEYGVEIKNKNLLALFLEHVIRSSLGKVSPHESELNIALALKGYEEGMTQENWMHSTAIYLNQLYKDILPQVDKSLKGQLILCNCEQLKLLDGCIFCKGKKIHGITESYTGMVSPEVVKAFKAGNICLFNGPITNLLANKLNLAVLSDPQMNVVFTDEEREIIAAYVPWTRKTTSGTTSYHGKTINDMEHFLLSNQDELVLKPCGGYGGKGIRVGVKTPRDQWVECVKTALEGKNWVVQERVDGLPGVYQVDDGYDDHDIAWGFFVFGSQYTGAWARVMPQKKNKGVINCHQGATVSVIFEVDE